MNILNHIINSKDTAENALIKLNTLGNQLTLFVIDENSKVVGSLTDGDLRRGFLKGYKISNSVNDFMNDSYSFIYENRFSFNDIINFKSKGVHLLPELSSEGRLIYIYDLQKQKSLLPITAFIMAGGEGIRLRPLTQNVPKPLLLVGNKPILEHNIDRLIDFGIRDIYISLNYLGNQIKDYFGNGESKGVRITYVNEEIKLGTAGSLGLIDHIQNDTILLLNSDILSNIDYEDFYINYLNSKCHFMAACIPYKVMIPYAIFELQNDSITALKEKPTYTYFSNAGIYLLSKLAHSFIPKNSYFNATDLMEKLINENVLVKRYELLDYWMDIGKMDDYLRAQDDIRHLKL